LGELITRIEAGWSPSCQARPREGDEWGVLKVSACSWGAFLEEENKAVIPGTEPRRDIEVRVGDLLISRANTLELVARSVVVEQCGPGLMLSDKTLRLVPIRDVDAAYLNLANLSPVARAHYAANATGTSASMRNVSQEAIRATPIPLPPLRVQREVVAAVRRMELLGASLRAALEASTTRLGAFAAAAVHHLDV
jgi:type I restriction enzyme S subunit